MSLSFKLYFKSGDIRRISTDGPVTWAAFQDLLEDLYKDEYHRELSVKYVDEEGDRITVSTEAEWKYALGLLASEKKSPLLKLYIEEGRSKGAYFKDGGAPKPLGFYKKVEGSPEPVVLPLAPPASEKSRTVAAKDAAFKKLQEGVPACLRSLFKNGKILPYNMPEYLRGCIKINPLPHNEVDIDVDIFQLYDTLHKYSLRCLNSSNKAVLAEGLRVLQAMRFIGEKNPITAYNEACAHALLGDKDSAARSLMRAVAVCGYSDLRHLTHDSDLNSIRDTEGYKTVVDVLRKKLAPASIPLVPLRASASATVVVKPVAEKEACVAKGPWAPQLQKLKSMGFDNEKLLTALLTKYHGNLQNVIAALL